MHWLELISRSATRPGKRQSLLFLLFQMFGIRQASHAIVRRIGGAISARYLSDATSKSDSSSGASTSWASSETNELVKQLSSRIKAGGPITVAEFMRESLLNPQYVRCP